MGNAASAAAERRSVRDFKVCIKKLYGNGQASDELHPAIL